MNKDVTLEEALEFEFPDSWWAMDADSLPAVDLDALTAILGDTGDETDEDLWAKLELPTPPLSPECSPVYSVEDEDACCDDFEPRETDCNVVDWHSDCESDESEFRNPYVRRDGKHDCMWNGSCIGSAQCFRRTSQPLTNSCISAAAIATDFLLKAETTLNVSVTRTESTPIRGRPHRARSLSESSCSSSASSSDSSCSERSFDSPNLPPWVAEQQHTVESTPAPYPHSDHSYHAGYQESATPRDALGILTPSDSEEEIDVVTLPDKRIKTEPSKSSHHRTGVSPSLPYERQLQLAVVQAAQRQQCPTTNNTATGSERTLRRRRRNQGLRLTLKRVRPLVRAGAKRLKAEADSAKRPQVLYHISSTPSKALANRNSAVHQSPGPLRLSSQDANCSSSSAGSEEDTGKRKEHNDMERKRRNDLKGSFQILRREVPELAHNERAPKVQILTRASNYIEQLVTTEKRLIRNKDSQQQRNIQLRRQLAALQRKRSFAN